jgi:hypothetical protein
MSKSYCGIVNSDIFGLCFISQHLTGFVCFCIMCVTKGAMKLQVGQIVSNLCLCFHIFIFVNYEILLP